MSPLPLPLIPINYKISLLLLRAGNGRPGQCDEALAHQLMDRYVNLGWVSPLPLPLIPINYKISLLLSQAGDGRPGQCDEALAHQIMDRYVKLGGNFIDTANVYMFGRSEEIVGTWLQK